MLNKPIDTLLPLLDKVKQTGNSKWVACCPAHDDKTPSMAIKETESGMILIRCFAGCGFNEIVASVGLLPEDLFPEKPSHHKRAPERQPFSPNQVLKCVFSDLQKIAIASRAIANKQEITEDDYQAFSEAIERVEDAISKAERVL